MLWIKALHIIFMVTWFSGLFYLPRLFVYHAMSEEQSQRETFKTMERKLLIMTHIGGSLTLIFGIMLLIIWPHYMAMGWMQLKLVLVAVLVAYHIWCVRLVAEFRRDKNTRSHRWYRIFNEIPVLFLFAIVFLVVLRPF
ncbi:MAG: CopD family protein [Gammaproteobacteria bacterium]|nr:CopD family protein [Gammaproteobacteria bacterium]